MFRVIFRVLHTLKGIVDFKTKMRKMKPITEHEGEQLFSCMNSQKQAQDIWYWDSGCSNHMTENKSLFVDLEENFSEAKLGDGKIHKSERKGTIVVETKGDNENLIFDVFYVPKLTSNFLSAGQLMWKGYSALFEEDKCKIVDQKNNSTIATVRISSTKAFPIVMLSEVKLASEIRPSK